MRKRSETKPKRGFPLAAPPPPPRLEGLSGAGLEGEGERLGGQLHPTAWSGARYLSTKAWRPKALATPRLGLASRYMMVLCVGGLVLLFIAFKKS